MATLQELLAQQAALERQIAAAKSESRAAAIAQVKQILAEQGLTVADISGALSSTRKTGANAGKKIAAKYQDPASGATWTGRGLKPKWLKAALENGKTLADFAV